MEFKKKSFLGYFEQSLDRLCSLFYNFLFRSCVLIILLSALFVGSTAADPDLFARMAIGKLIFSDGKIPLTDPFAFTPKKDIWVDHEWLAGAYFYLFHLFGGDQALFIAKIIFALFALLLIAKAARVINQREIPLPILLLLALELSVVWASTIRAQVFTYLFIPLLLLGIVLHRKNGQRLLLLMTPLYMIIWANAHGGFVVGLGLLGIYSAVLIKERIFETAESNKNNEAIFVANILLLTILATLINPYGLEYWNFMSQALAHPRSSITEWAPVSISSILFIFALLLSLCVFPFLNRRVPLEGWGMLIASAYYGISHQRLTPIFVMVFAVYLLPLIIDLYFKIYSPKSPRFQLFRRSLALVISGFVIFSLSRAATPFLPRFSLDYSFYPVKALEWLKVNRAGGNLLVDFNRGSFALWNLYPQFKISLDGRYEEVYPESTVDIVSRALNQKNPDCPNALKIVNPDYILISIQDTLIRDPVGSDFRPCAGNWSEIYRDKDFIVYERFF